MDDFKLKFEIPEFGDSAWLDFQLRAIVNGKELDQVFDFCEMLPAIGQNGRFPLFNCTCGVFECGGYHVDVECSPDAWIWKVTNYLAYDGESKQWRTSVSEYRISWSQVETAIEQIRGAILELRERQPNHEFLASKCAKSFLELENTPANLPGGGRVT